LTKHTGRKFMQEESTHGRPFAAFLIFLVISFGQTGSNLGAMHGGRTARATSTPSGRTSSL